MSRMVRTIVAAVLLIAWLQPIAVAGPAIPAPPPSDPEVTVRAPSAAASPWLDLGPSTVLERGSNPDKPRYRPLAASLTLAGIYAGFVTWTYFAWYRTETREFRWADPTKDGNWKLWSDEGWFGSTRYAGGADKLGHAWATLALARAGTELLHQWGGYDRLTSAIVGTALSEALFLGVEIKDGFAYTFSFGDFAFNTLGAALAFAQSMSPAVDDLVDFRVEYFPSAAYRESARGGDLDVAEDYSGQTYLLAFHLGAIKPLREARWGGWTRFVDVTLGFESRGYRPKPPPGETYERSQASFIGLSLNAQGLFDYLLRGRSEPLRKFTHGAFEVFNLPYTSVQVLDRTTYPTGMIPDEEFRTR